MELRRGPVAFAIEAFAADDAPDAWSNLIDRLLASEHEVKESLQVDVVSM